MSNSASRYEAQKWCITPTFESLYAPALKLKEENDKLINTIQTLADKKVQAYWIWPADTGAVMTTDLSWRPVSNTLQTWKCRKPLQTVDDDFNDKLNYSWDNFRQCVEYNSSSLVVLKKYELYGNNAKASFAARAFTANLQIVQRELKNLLWQIQSMPPTVGYGIDTDLMPYVELSATLAPECPRHYKDPLYTLKDASLETTAGEIIIGSVMKKTIVGSGYHYEMCLLTNKASTAQIRIQEMLERDRRTRDVTRFFRGRQSAYELAPLVQLTLMATCKRLCQPIHASAGAYFALSDGLPSYVPIQQLSARELKLREEAKSLSSQRIALRDKANALYTILLNQLHCVSTDREKAFPAHPVSFDLQRQRRADGSGFKRFDLLFVIRNLEATTCMLQRCIELAEQLAAANADTVDCINAALSLTSSTHWRLVPYTNKRRQEIVDAWKPSAEFAIPEDTFHVGLLPLTSFGNMAATSSNLVGAIKQYVKKLGEDSGPAKIHVLQHLRALEFIHEELCDLYIAVQKPLAAEDVKVTPTVHRFAEEHLRVISGGHIKAAEVLRQMSAPPDNEIIACNALRDYNPSCGTLDINIITSGGYETLARWNIKPPDAWNPNTTVSFVGFCAFFRGEHPHPILEPLTRGVVAAVGDVVRPGHLSNPSSQLLALSDQEYDLLVATEQAKYEIQYWENIIKELEARERLMIIDESAPALHKGSKAGDVAAVHGAVSRGENVNQVDAEGRSALLVAVMYGRDEVVGVLLGAGARVDRYFVRMFPGGDIGPPADTLLTYACELGNVDMYEMLMRAGASKPKDPKVCHFALDNSNFTRIQQLLAAWAPVLVKPRLISEVLVVPEADTAARLKSVRWANVTDRPRERAGLKRKRDIGTSHKAIVVNAGELTLGDKIGEGEFAIVYRAKWKDTAVAVKQFALDNLPGVLEQAFGEVASTNAALNHARVVRTMGICSELSRVAFVMELMEGGSLFDRLQRVPKLSWEFKEAATLDVARGLAYLHSQSVVHGDLRSRNVLLDGAGRAKLSDVGLSTLRVPTIMARTRSAAASGSTSMQESLRWMAPELLEGHRCTPASDVYALGVVLWEIATQSIPYVHISHDAILMDFVRRGNREAIPPDIPVQFANLIGKCWSQNPTDRPTAAVVAALTAIPL